MINDSRRTDTGPVTNRSVMRASVPLGRSGLPYDLFFDWDPPARGPENLWIASAFTWRARVATEERVQEVILFDAPPLGIPSGDGWTVQTPGDPGRLENRDRKQ